MIPLGACLVVMNSAFYLALDRQPIAPVAAIEFVGTIGIALWGLRTGRNYPAFALAILGAALLIDVPSLFEAEGETLTSDLLGLSWAVLNGGMFVLYIVHGHKISEGGASGRVERLGAAMTALTIVSLLGVGIMGSSSLISSPVVPDVSADPGTTPLALSRAIVACCGATALAALPPRSTIGRYGILAVIVARSIPLAAASSGSARAGSWFVPVIAP